MRAFLYIVGGIACVGLIIAAMYIAMGLGLSIYIAYGNQVRGREYAAKRQADELQSSQQSLAAVGKNMIPSLPGDQHDQDELSGKLPSLFVDAEGYGTEDNWLATTISREIAEMAFLAAKPTDPVPTFQVKATVDPQQGRIHVDIQGVEPQAASLDLTPAFIWDPGGYESLAQHFVTASAQAGVPVTKENDVLKHLLRLTGPELAKEDVRLSGNLQAHPESWQDHEEAALLLTALALREESGGYPDKRLLLCKATAHLAVAQALRGDTVASWPGLIAGAAIRTLAGREIDALAHLDNLKVQPDIPESAKPWLSALRTLAKQDWREAEVTPDSPLLIKITWFQMVSFNLGFPLDQDDYIVGTDEPSIRLLKIVPPPAADPTAPPEQQPTNPDTLLPDWERINGHSPYNDSAYDDVKNAQYNLDLEFHELEEILKIEGEAQFDMEHLPDLFHEEKLDSVSTDTSGRTVVHVIGPGGFKADALNHIFNCLISSTNLLRQSQDVAERQDFFTKTDDLFRGVPGYDLIRLQLDSDPTKDPKPVYAALVAAKKTWPVWELPNGINPGMPGYARFEAFYRPPVPYGTAFEPGGFRYGLIQDTSPQVWPPFDTPELEQIKKLPLAQANAKIEVYTQRYNDAVQAKAPKGPLPLELDLLKLDPDAYSLAQDHIPDDRLWAATSRFFDYNLHPIARIESLDAQHLSNADRITILRKHVALQPLGGFRAAVVLRGQGLADEAAEMDRKAFASGGDAVGISNSVLPLVDYDLSHGLKDEALKVATFAGQTNSEMGLSILTFALEKLGRLDEAEAAAKQDSAIYSDDSWTNNFQLRHPDRFPQVYAAEMKKAFPDGMQHAALADFSGSPRGGDQVKSNSDTMRAVGLQPGDVVVGLDGFRVESDAQYIFVRALSMESKMDFVIWRKDRYLEVQAFVPGRRLMVDIGDYIPAK